MNSRRLSSRPVSSGPNSNPVNQEKKIKGILINNFIITSKKPNKNMHFTRISLKIFIDKSRLASDVSRSAVDIFVTMAMQSTPSPLCHRFAP